MLRSLLLALSRRGEVGRALDRFAFTRRSVRRFVGGETLDEALEAQKAFPPGTVGALTYLGENVGAPDEAAAAADAYIKVLDRIQAAGLRCTISLKLTHMGLDIGEDLCLVNLRRIVARAAAQGNFVRIDMEGSAYTTTTLLIYERLREESSNVGPAIQAYLRRSEGDLLRLVESGANVRLCKGAYREPQAMAFPKKRDVDRSYLRLTEISLSGEAMERGVYPAFATHDERIIRAIQRTVHGRRIPPDRYEFQMLYGIRPDLQRELAAAGHTMRVLVPFGREWYGYFMRRLAERPANVLFVLKNLFRR